MGMKSNSNNFKGTNGAKKHEEMVKHKPLLKLNIQLFAEFPTQPSQLKHMFRKSDGHLIDTPRNRSKIKKMTENKRYYKGPDKDGNDCYSKRVLGGQYWATTRNGIIQNCGFNKNGSIIKYVKGVGMKKSKGKVRNK